MCNLLIITRNEPTRTGEADRASKVRRGFFKSPAKRLHRCRGSSEVDVTLKFPHRDPKPSARADCPSSLARQTPLAPFRPTCESAVFPQACGGAISGNGRVGLESRGVDRCPCGFKVLGRVPLSKRQGHTKNTRTQMMASSCLNNKLLLTQGAGDDAVLHEPKGKREAFLRGCS